jgi:hypothetical protein
LTSSEAPPVSLMSRSVSSGRPSGSLICRLRIPRAPSRSSVIGLSSPGAWFGIEQAGEPVERCSIAREVDVGQPEEREGALDLAERVGRLDDVARGDLRCVLSSVSRASAIPACRSVSATEARAGTAGRDRSVRWANSTLVRSRRTASERGPDGSLLKARACARATPSVGAVLIPQNRALCKPRERPLPFRFLVYKRGSRRVRSCCAGEHINGRGDPARLPVLRQRNFTTAWAIHDLCHWGPPIGCSRPQLQCLRQAVALLVGPHKAHRTVGHNVAGEKISRPRREPLRDTVA